jgi:hypothetical protein
MASANPIIKGPQPDYQVVRIDDNPARKPPVRHGKSIGVAARLLPLNFFMLQLAANLNLSMPLELPLFRGV